VGLRIAKVDQQSITEILGNMPRKALDDLGTGGLIGPDDLPVVFRVKLARKRRGIDHIAKHDGNLAAFGLRPVRDSLYRCGLERGSRPGMRVVHCLGSGWDGLWQRSCIACPDEDAALLIHRQAFRVYHFLFEAFEIRVIQVETQLEGEIREALFTCEQVDNLR
jgi:hypothetical protein